jgi:carboxyvinyl-carboxyphosphonate phosphorylmutase
MPLKTFSERRKRLREIINADTITNPGTVFDGISARTAQLAGFELGLMGGSIVSHTVLSAPDIMLITLSELAEQVRRACRVSDICLMVDADHGYGNALNVARTVQEIEAAGASSLSIEDTLLPQRFGQGTEVISREEFAGKLAAAVSARVDPSFVIVGRIEAMPVLGFDEVLARVEVCSKAGVDLIFARGAFDEGQLDKLSSATNLPFQLQAGKIADDVLIKHRVRIVGHGHVAYMTMLKGLYDGQKHMHDGGTVAALGDRVLPPELQKLVLGEEGYNAMVKEFLT